MMIAVPLTAEMAHYSGDLHRIGYCTETGLFSIIWIDNSKLGKEIFPTYQEVWDPLKGSTDKFHDILLKWWMVTIRSYDLIHNLKRKLLLL